MVNHGRMHELGEREKGGEKSTELRGQQKSKKREF